MAATPTSLSTPVRLVTLKGKNSSKKSTTSIRPRRAIQSVDTTLGVYDRTDPFLAFNVLLRLLGSLPSRIGGCQFKLSPEEHKLSLHLLSIVEPFVGLAPSRRTITRQPTEILDAIVFHVDSKHDLLSLALSCRRMHGIVFPRHFDYRKIRCKVSSIRVWNHLIVHRSLARNVRSLEILDERSTEPESVPSEILTSDTDLESTDDELSLHTKQERYLVAALAKMTALASFLWSCNHSPISIDNVWPTLLKCNSLREVEINDNLVFSPSAPDQEKALPTNNLKRRRPTVFPELKMIALRSTKHIYGSTKYPVLCRISGMLDHCPNLESLDIAYVPPRTSLNSYPPADELLLYSRWPQLTSLSLTNLRCSPVSGFDAAANFLTAHLNLEVLHLDIGATAGIGGAGSRLILEPGSLPRLRELKSNKEIANAILQCSCDTPRPLETIKGVRLSSSYTNVEDQVFLANLKRCGKNVKRVELVGWNEMEDIKRLVESAPGLTWLDVGKKAGSPARDRAGAGTVAPVINTVEWASILSVLTDLTTFHGVRFFYEVSPQVAATPSSSTSTNITITDRSRIRKNDEVASVLAWKCLKLRRVDHWEDGGGKVVVLVRDGERDKDKVRWEVRRVKQ